MDIKILVVEDDIRFRELVVDFLKDEGYKVLQAKNGSEAVDIFFEQMDIALVILDIMMPIMDGWQVLGEIRKHKETPVILLTALGDEKNEIAGLRTGADDYITKPFSYEVFMARVKAALRKTMQEKQAELTFCSGYLKINQMNQKVYLNQEEIKLSAREYNLLTYLIRNKNKVLSREQILNEVWGYDYYGDTRNIDTYVKVVRSKLKEHGELIKTIRGIGYMFEVK